jgi:hypothetical protein
MSSLGAAHRFQRWVGQPSNIDKCERCQEPRSVHGPDWTCPSAPTGRLATAAGVTGAVLLVTGIVLRLLADSGVGQGDAMLMADAVFAGIMLIAAGVLLGGRDH